MMEKNKITREDMRIRSILQEAGREQPSMDFTSRVMAEVKKEAYTPVISRKAWAFAVFFLALLCTGAFLPTQSDSKDGVMGLYLNIIPWEQLKSNFIQMGSSAPESFLRFFLLITVAGGLLILLDKLVFKKDNQAG